ncbi:unnamed protein product [Medioppia subpectinata]|uniref:Uncharacterized protein n=1 Tax=Medioppia subpectinata TaxID=1979941 RepID=A0A7R9KNA7_9ACAR|nr:unnamed protein product [Medioppia subpectinata]CAG2106721.1 unnamed protein product [Medioppia subpectinata]
MSVTSLNCKEALEAIRGARSISSPNYGFQRQLEEFELRKLKTVRRLIRSHHNVLNSPEMCDNSLTASARSGTSTPVGPSRGSPAGSPQLGTSYRRSPHVPRKLTTTLLRENKTL